ncbi:MAG TPA: YhcH/YjgK/YiaL family protein [Opitutus sp.]|nr:YhcH/YjgK/YiaL family protein [Opitutus sp.]
MALFGTLETIRTQVAPAEKFAAAFAYLDELLRGGSDAAKRIRGIPVGETQKIELAGGAFAMEQVYRTKARADGFFESHRKMIDVQVIVEGEEWIEVADLAHCVVKQPFQEERDLIVHQDVGAASRLRLRAGDAAIFFPADVHMPCLETESGSGIVRKTVIKVPVAGS